MDDGGERSVREVATEQRSVVQRAGGAFGVSIVAHLVFVGVLAILPRDFLEQHRAHEIEIELVAPTTVEVPPQPLEPELEAEATEAPAVRERPETPESTPVAPGAVVDPSTQLAGPAGGGTGELGAEGGPSIQAPAVGEPSGPIDPTERARLGALVAPGAAASSWVVQGAEGPSMPSGPAGLAATGGRPRLATAEEASGALTAHLRGTAMARPWLSRTEPRLTPRPDGSLEYRGHAFTARIAPDGAVSFSDRDAIQADEMLQGGPARFDITDMIMRGSGQDPYGAEREWFMEHTEEVRARLETEARARERDSALRGVPGRLAAIWNQERPAFLRRRAIFRLWDDCEEEGDGLNVRRQVVEFVRANLPQTSADAFTVQEINEMNARRDSTMEFRPY